MTVGGVVRGAYDGVKKVVMQKREQKSALG
jgi:hypothetical protein